MAKVRHTINGNPSTMANVMAYRETVGADNVRGEEWRIAPGLILINWVGPAPRGC